MNRQITMEMIEAYRNFLCREEKAGATIEKYIRDIKNYMSWLCGREAARELTAQWKLYLQKMGYAPRTVNSMLSAVNGIFSHLGWQDCRAKFLKIQRQSFRDESRELTKEEFGRLVEAARFAGKDRLLLAMETICGTGMRVSELNYITVEAVKAGKAEISLKGKIRSIMIPRRLCRKLLQYIRREKIGSGRIFLTRNGNGLFRRQIWWEMKRLCAVAGVEASKVFPHNLRHLFARLFYKASKDIVKLADILGHSSIDTTRLYLLTTGAEHLRQLDCLGLIS